VRLLSELNIWLSLLLLVVFLVVGPTGFLLGLYVTVSAVSGAPAQGRRDRRE
jgi:choline-glycine betaine transporter